METDQIIIKEEKNINENQKIIKKEIILINDLNSFNTFRENSNSHYIAILFHANCAKDSQKFKNSFYTIPEHLDSSLYSLDLVEINFKSRDLIQEFIKLFI